MTKPILYTMNVSPPCRAVELCAKALDLDLERKEVNLATEDHLKPEFVLEPRIQFGGGEIPADRVEYVLKSFQQLEDTLVDDYVVCNSLAIVDFSCVSVVTSISGVVPMDKNRYPKVHDWLDRLKELLRGYEEANGVGAEVVAKFVLSQKEKNARKA